MKKILILFATIFMVLSLVGCSEKNSSTAKDDKLNFIMATAPAGLHPTKTNDAPSSTITSQIFETLYLRSYDGLSYEPLLAKELPIMSEDGLTATIKLRENVSFQNGDPFTADAVAYLIDCAKDPDYGHMRQSIVESIESYEIVDDHTIDLHLKYSDGVLTAKLAHTNAAIVNPAVDKVQDLMTDPTGAGTGPYKYVSSITGSNYVLEANENYWNGAPEVKTINFDIVADESTIIARLQTGEADLYYPVSANAFSTVENIPGYTAENIPSSSIYYLALRSNEGSVKNPLMTNVEFRKAIIQAIDFDSFVNSMLDGKASQSKSIVGPTLVGYTEAMEEAGIGYDLDAAKATIEANGWSGQKITMLTATRQWQQDLAVYIQGELAKVGIEMDIVSEEWASFLSTAKTDTAGDILMLTWANVTGDGQQMLEPNFGTTNGVRVKYNNAEFDTLVDAAAKTTVLEERQKYMLEAVNKIMGDAIVAPMYSTNQLFVYNSDKFDNVQIDKGGLFFVCDFKLK